MNVRTDINPVDPAKAKAALLDRARWAHMRAPGAPAEACRDWLAMIAEGVPGLISAVVVLDDGGGSFAPAAFHPDTSRAVDPDLASLVEIALSEARPASRDYGGGDCGISVPLEIDGAPAGAVAVRIPTAHRREALAHIRWGAGWLEALLLRIRRADAEEDAGRVEAVLECLAVALDTNGFRKMADAVAINLALKMDCELVAIGFRKGRHTRVRSLNHTSDFEKKTSLVRDIARAMDEAMDQGAIMDWPSQRPGQGLAHTELAERHEMAHVLTVPFSVGQRLAGAMTFERRGGAPFDTATVQQLDCIAAVVGPVLEQARLEDRPIFSKVAQSVGRQMVRLLGPGHVARKLIGLGLAGAIFAAATVTHEGRVTADARIEGEIQRTVAAPFEGYIAEALVRAGQTVEQGELLTRLDDRDLTLDRLRWTTTLRQRQTEFDRALADGDRSQASVVRTQIDHAEAQVALIDAEITRSRLVAPFSGVVISGDLSQRVGSVVGRGEALFTLAPLDSYRVVIDVDERDVANVSPGQTGRLVVMALPETPLDYRVVSVTPVNTAQEGQNLFRVEAMLETADPRLRPGMEGVARIMIGERLVFDSWTHRLTDWFRLVAWRWWG